jgi:hypothetical protein
MAYRLSSELPAKHFLKDLIIRPNYGKVHPHYAAVSRHAAHSTPLRGTTVTVQATADHPNC